MLDDSLAQLCDGHPTTFYAPRLYNSRVIYLNKSNTKWILIGISPGDDGFLPEAYICSKDYQIKIPGDLREFFEKTATLSGVTGFGTSTSVSVKFPSKASLDDFNIAKSDFGSGTYKIWNSSNGQRCIYVAATTLAYLQGLSKPLINLHRSTDVKAIESAFEKVVVTTAAIAETLDCYDCQLMEAEMFQHPPPDVDMNFFCETICNFRKFFYRQVRNRINQ